MNRSEQKTVNVFDSGMNLDLSDMVMPSKVSRYALNMRIVNLSGSSFVLSNLLGNEVKFQLTSGFEPVAAQEFNGVLYIASWNPTDSRFELGSYPSPDYGNPSSGNIYVYRPLNNLDAGPFRTSAFAYDTRPKISKLEIQPDYDQSVNMVFTTVGKTPRIVNTKFKVNPDSQAIELEILADRASAANSNSYTSGTVDKETSLILYSDKVMKIAFNAIQSGGKLKPGNYTYVFQYMTEDFNTTGVIGQSLVCQVAHGTTGNNVKGGDETQETSKRVVLDLTSVDTDFTYLKVYVLYSSGQEGISQQTLEFTKPITITGTTMQFIHTGYEELAEVSADTVNVDFAAITSARASTQIGGYYVLGGVTQRSTDYTIFKNAAATILPVCKVSDLPATTLPEYADPANVYNYLGYMGGESYPFGIVFILPGNVLSPVFPIQGQVFLNNGDDNGSTITVYTMKDGVVVMPYSGETKFYKSGKVRVKHLQLDLSGIDAQVKANSLGFFIVRGERRPWALTQGAIIPTMLVPPVEYMLFGSSGPVYEHTYTDATNEDRYKAVPLLDSLIEAFGIDTIEGDPDDQVMNGDLTESNNGRMPIFINDTGLIGGAVANIPSDKWAFFSGEAQLNEPEFVTMLQRATAYVGQIGKASFLVESPFTKQYSAPTIVTGMHYKMTSIDNASYNGTNITTLFKLLDRLDYVIGETFATGSAFISKVIHRFFYNAFHDPSLRNQAYQVYAAFNSYFGLKLASGQSLIESFPGATSPQGGNSRNANFVGTTSTGATRITSGVSYNNNGTTVPAAWIANIYPNNQLPYTLISGNNYQSNLYPTIDTVTYKQCSPWFTWSDVPVSGPMQNKILVYGGDCYVGKISKKLYQSGFRNSASSGTDPWPGANMPCGTLLTWYQESKYNLALRQPKLFDESESQQRSFFPYESNGDALAYQKYRYPETYAHSPGYKEVLPPKSFFSPPSLAPYIENDFFSRIYHSERHIPNAFKNGYRSFLPSAYRDYDSSMGRIVGMFNHRGKLLIVFQHGIGITDVNQRIQTGADAAGAIFVEPSGVLPPNIQYVSREIGCQDHLSLVQTPSAVYGVDRSRDKIWKFSDNLKVISDDILQSFLINNIVAPRTGYDPEYLEVIFTTDNWTLCFREGMEVFTAFYSFQGNFYARRRKDFFSFLESTAWKHNAPVYTIYGEQKNSIIEFVINQNIAMTKVVDYLNIISNEVPPTKVEFYSYNQDVEVAEAIQAAMLNQYSVVNNVFDPVDDMNPIMYRDKKFVLRSPHRTDYNTGSAADEWDIGGRVRDKYIIVRLTYNATQPLELASVVSSFRYSPS